MCCCAGKKLSLYLPSREEAEPGARANAGKRPFCCSISPVAWLIFDVGPKSRWPINSKSIPDDACIQITPTPSSSILHTSSCPILPSISLRNSCWQKEKNGKMKSGIKRSMDGYRISKSRTGPLCRHSFWLSWRYWLPSARGCSHEIRAPNLRKNIQFQHKQPIPYGCRLCNLRLPLLWSMIRPCLLRRSLKTNKTKPNKTVQRTRFARR